jgi:hypothetical protein
MRVGQRCAVVERQPNSVRARSNGEDAIGRSLSRAVPNHEKVVIIVDQFIGSGQTLAQYFPYGTNQRRVFRIEFPNKACKLLLACRIGFRNNSF